MVLFLLAHPVFPGWAMPTLIFFHGGQPPTLHPSRAGAHALHYVHITITLFLQVLCHRLVVVVFAILTQKARSTRYWVQFCLFNHVKQPQRSTASFTTTDSRSPSSLSPPPRIPLQACSVMAWSQRRTDPTRPAGRHWRQDNGPTACHGRASGRNEKVASNQLRAKWWRKTVRVK